MAIENLHSQDVWDTGYNDLVFGTVSDDDQVAQWLKAWTPKGGAGSCCEIGCFPGKYLALYGDLGYELNGVDLTPRTDPEMIHWLRSRGYRLGKVGKEDFFQWQPEQHYDVVYSVGFIEHYSHWDEVLSKHAEWVKPGGLLMVTAPNFRGTLQKFLHQWVDNENLERHYLPAMDPALWAERLQKAGFEILYSGYFAQFDFWVGVQERTLIQKLAFWTLRALLPLLRFLLPRDWEFSSPYCGLVARKVLIST